MSKLQQAIIGAETRLPYGYAIVLAIKHGEVSVYLNVKDSEFHEAKDKDLPIHEQIDILVEEALEMRGPRSSVCISCEAQHADDAVTLEDVVIDIDNARKAIIEAIVKMTEKEAESKTELITDAD